MILRVMLEQLVAQRDRLQAAIDALEALQGTGAGIAAPRRTALHQTGDGKPARGRPAAKSKAPGIHRPPKKGMQRRAAWDVAEAKKLYEAGRPLALIARAVEAPSVAAVGYHVQAKGWKRPKGFKPDTSGRGRVRARVDTAQRVCDGCHQPSTTNPCHCGHIHG